MQGNQKPAISDDDFARYLTPSGRLDLDRLLNEQTSSGAVGKNPLKAKNNRASPQMFYQAKPTFRHRQNRDGVIDSICYECLVTVATARIEYGLLQNEQAHVCDPVRIYQLFTDPSRRLNAA